MIKRSQLVGALATLVGVAAVTAGAQAQAAAAAAKYPARAVRRDIPMTNMIRRAFAAGTRDSTGRPGPNYWQLWMDYTINARFDPSTSTITGQETTIIHNNSDSAMHAIVLRLDQNLFAPNVPRAEVVTDITYGMKVTKLTLNGAEVDLNPPPRRRRRRGQPAPPVTLAAYGLNLTSARISLPTPIAAHSTATLGAEWNFEVPKVISPTRGIRMGRWGDTLYQVGQWYPRVAVYDDLRQGGWDTDPYLGPSEFYNNFGHFDVKLDMPAGWIVGATGVLQNPEEVLTPKERERLSHVLQSDSQQTIVGANERGPGVSTAGAPGGRLVWHFVIDTAGDFAWATSNQFVWDATRADIPGKGEIPVNIMYLAGHSQEYAQAGAIARHALEFYSKLWMPYTFKGLTMVDGPELGMEYPSFIMSSARASDHEIGHQWWPMMVGTNETWYGFMDEGFNQYMNILSAADRQHQPPELDGRGQSYGRMVGDEREAPLMWDANYGGPRYSFQAYGKAPEMLSSLGGVVGDTAVWRAMSGYAKAWRFKHPSPWDYAFFMDHALHRNLGWFWNAWLFNDESVDGSIQQVKTAGRKTTVTVRQDGQMPSPVVLAVQFAPTGPRIRPMRNSRMKDSLTAIVTYPVTVWFAGSRTFTATLDFGGRKIQKITLDPRGRFPDRNVSDDVWPRSANAAAQADGGRRRGGRP
ncbi:MAG TPA: M1 family metallopeptidase [Gemmatimonadaceae bacterium]|nr:M1 family metallopeptidase [Gemmatimonadaceae bacterium]